MGGYFLTLFPVRQLISDPSPKTDFDQARERKTGDAEKGKERGLGSKDSLLAPHLFMLSFFSACLFMSPSDSGWTPFSSPTPQKMIWTVVSLERIGLGLLVEVEERGVRRGDGSNHSIPSFSQAGSTLVGHRISRTSTRKSCWAWSLWSES